MGNIKSVPREIQIKLDAVDRNLMKLRSRVRFKKDKDFIRKRLQKIRIINLEMKQFEKRMYKKNIFK